MKKILLILLLIFSSNTIAESAMSISTFKRLQKIEELIIKDKKLEAEDKLKAFLEEPPSRDIDKAYLYYTAGMYYIQEPAYAKSKKYLLKSYELNALPDRTILYILQSLAGLSMQEEKLDTAIKYYKDYLKLAKKPNKNVYLGLGSAYFFKKEYKKSIKTLVEAKKFFAKKKSIYLMLFSSYYELKQLENATVILEEMVWIWPEEKKHWLQLSSLFMEQEKYPKALEIMQIAHTKKFLTKENDIMQFVYVLNRENMPHKAFSVLKIAINQKVVKESQKNYELLSTLGQEAKERNEAIKALKKAAQYSTTGKNDLYIAQLYFEQEDQFKNVIKYAKQALKKTVKQKGSANMIIAVAYSELDDIENAKIYLKKASKYKKTKESAQKWLESLNNN